ncbi:hypothetical protein [Natrinema sp. SYSU A 869]|uniref:hypothetical protein n=1 Tax=Natrinema sp. SYSU A 869 TaxID=2871694 RepID=UPI001CA42806|nr:hypothetical protein [Natrinema sp. SYSU A 869]
MTGFKSGSAGDPFGDDDREEDDEEELTETSSTAIDTESNTDRDDDRDDASSGTSPSPSSGGLPWIYERNSITDGRAQTVQLHLQQSTLDRQRETRTGVETALGEAVKKADLREAALLVGLEHVDEVADQLREWGYDFE